VVLSGAAIICLSTLASGQDANRIVQQAVRTELAADASDHTRWLYYEEDRKPGLNVRQWVAETSIGDLRRVIEKNGSTPSKADERRSINDYIGDSEAQTKEKKGNQHDDEQAAEMLRRLPEAFLWTKIGEQGTNTILHFKPNPEFNPPTWQSRVFAAMAGEMRVDNSEHRIVSLKGHMIHNVKFWGGLLGSLQSGGSFDVERRQVGHGEWSIVETHIHIQGHALIFKSISEQEDDLKSKFQELPPRESPPAAENALLAQNG
jgi:hypothetical protein